MQGFGNLPNRNSNSLDEVKTELEKLKTGIIAVSDNPSTDEIASACSLYLALMKKGYEVYLFSDKKIDSKLIAADKFSQSFEVSGNNLEISFPYEEGSVNDVSAKIENGRFIIVLVPAEGANPPDYKDVKFAKTGGSIDFVITVGVPTLQRLGSIYQQKKDLLDSAQIINIDRQFNNNYYGVLNYVSTSYSSVSEIIYQLALKLAVEIDQDMATNLYIGLVSATNYFRSMSVKPETFEMASYLYKVGVRKELVSLVLGQSQPSVQPSGLAGSRPFGSSVGSSVPRFLGSENQQKTVKFNLNNQRDASADNKPQQSSQKAPEDWLRPKIFTSKDQ